MGLILSYILFVNYKEWVGYYSGEDEGFITLYRCQKPDAPLQTQITRQTP
ncbi:MAG: hypothetical protein JWL81_1425 [Verrucomicrobiales bacterium]|nr:hypothetical protein [Verrucomicrobiales bacterium]